jgi:molybdopterin-guanine dinucleotide biosynthesis protein A
MRHEHTSDMHLASGIILAGGESRRMGRDKAWIPFGGQALIERVIDRVGEVCQEIIVVTNNHLLYAGLGANLVRDSFPGKGSLGGIYSGLSAARCDRGIVVACDMPFLNAELLKYLLTLSDDYDVVIPSAPDLNKTARSKRDDPEPWKTNRPTAKDSDLHPLHAVYSKQCLGPMEARLRADDLRLISFHPDVRVRVVSQPELERFDPEHLSLLNVNTPEELAFAESIVVQRPPST